MFKHDAKRIGKRFCLLCLLLLVLYIFYQFVVQRDLSYFKQCHWSSHCNLENRNLERTFCNSVKLGVGLICPTLYASLGGNCSYNSTKVKCKDVRGLAAPYILRQAQLVITRVLASFNTVAKTHGIQYWLTSGSLLGAIRHNGFIPWDDDADIEMTIEEYEKFFRNASHHLPGDVFFQNSESDENMRPSDPEEYKRQRYKDLGLYKRPMNPRLRDMKSCTKYCIHNGCKWHDGLMVDIFVLETVTPRTYPLKGVLFEGLLFPVQNNWKEALVSKYGENFMEILPQNIKNRYGNNMPDPEHSCKELTTI